MVLKLSLRQLAKAAVWVGSVVHVADTPMHLQTCQGLGSVQLGQCSHLDCLCFLSDGSKPGLVLGLLLSPSIDVFSFKAFSMWLAGA